VTAMTAMMLSLSCRTILRVHDVLMDAIVD
jgi:hypothetical protein